jgi:hypothetical protein
MNRVSVYEAVGEKVAWLSSIAQNMSEEYWTDMQDCKSTYNVPRWKRDAGFKFPLIFTSFL